ncbi:hypothetical protein KXD40_005903 [Peronospora effusa]|uniref:Uncharacterized protein n=1 Tax=Peronospora effusa TaxID=542832 RepID=A0A425CIH3_9STRA|nr:hypothetical protein DD237_002456 [Peronospora effusa]UIZ27696.1 hypothetical protein KXD40_005903 [Peronospora effusa]
MERYRFKNDGLATHTSMDQEECENSCSLFFFPLLELPLNQQLQLQQLSFINTDLEPLLMREKHVEYLKRGLTRLSSGFVALDARYKVAETISILTFLINLIKPI